MSSSAPQTGQIAKMIGLGFGDAVRIEAGIARDHKSSLMPLSANQTTSFFLVSGFGSGAYSAKLLAGTRQRFSGLSQARQCGDDVFLIFVTG
jgi:hypothetical protein